MLTNGKQREAIAEWMARLLEPGQVVEVRAINPFRSQVFGTAAAGELERLVEFAKRASGTCQGVYFTPNPLKTARGSGSYGTALDTDIERRNWLLIDIDSRRPKDTNATDGERAQAEIVANAIAETLACRGFKGIIRGDSGNGFHLMIPVELPNDDEAHGLHKRLLKVLEERFGTKGALIDQTTANAARIWKLPGTLARKAADTSDRPHRQARLLEVPADCREHAKGNTALLAELLTHWHTAAPKKTTDAYVKGAIERECGRLACTPVGHLNDQLFKSAAAIGEFVGAGCLTDSEAFRLILAAAKAAGCDNPKKDEDTIRRGIEKGKLSPRKLPDPGAFTEWEEPAPLETCVGLERFPVDVFPVGLRQFVVEQAQALNVPTDYLGLMMLGVAGGAIGNTKRLRIKGGYTQSGAIYGVFVARPGVKKSAVVRAVTEPLQVAQARYQREHEKAVDELRAAGSKANAPPKRLCVTNGGTVEAIARRLAENPRGLILTTDELSGLVAGLNQYKAGGKGNDRQFFLSAWDQSGYSIERVEEGKSLYLPRPFLCVIGAIQPDVLATLRGSPDLLGNPAPDDGFFDRFLIAYPPEPRDEGETWLEASNAACGAWASAVEGLLALQASPGGTPQMVPLASSARDAYQEVTRRHAAEVNDEDFPDHLRGPWSKLIGYFARFILILHSLDGVVDGLVDFEADASHVERAAKLLRYFKSHARRGQALSLEGRTERQAKAILAWARGRVSWRDSDLWRHLRRNKVLFRNREELAKPLRLLCDMSLIRKCQEDKEVTSTGRPPGTRYETNPEAAEMTVEQVSGI